MASPRLVAAITGSLKKYMEEEIGDLASAARAAVEYGTTVGQSTLRAQVKAAGLGAGLEKAWRTKIFPKGNRQTLHPTGLIYSKAQKLHEAYNTGGIIRAKNGARFLAIPSENVPRKFSPRRLMTPLEVEAQFNRDLVFKPYANGRPGGVLVMPQIIRSKNQKYWRKNTSRRLAQGRREEDIIMFYLVPSATLEKKLDIEGAEAAAEAAMFQKYVEELNG